MAKKQYPGGVFNPKNKKKKTPSKKGKPSAAMVKRMKANSKKKRS